MIEASESYVDLMRSAPHWGFEITLELLSGLVVYPFYRWLHRKWESRIHREIDAEHGVIHTEVVSPQGVRVVVLDQSTYDNLVDKMGKEFVSEAERWIT